MDGFKKLILHPNFEDTLRELSKKDIFLPNYGVEQKLTNLNFLTDSGKVSNLEEIKGYKLDALNGSNKARDYTFVAYDESWVKFAALEGTAYFTAHSTILTGEKDYLPMVMATFYFYTRSRAITSNSVHIKYAEDVEVAYTRDYLRDKVSFLLEYVPSHCILFIDGPIISGDLYTIIMDANEKFLQKEILPIFFVKNSTSNIVTSNTDGLRGQYNSDMHWLHTLLKPAERSCFFKYEDQVNRKNTKVFCYMKAFDSSPQRIEFHTDAYLIYKDSIQDVMDMVFYLMLVQGSKTNPQLRPIAIAEAYARSVLQVIDIDRYFKEAKISPTLNQVRFGG